jgi:hypothetical protein
MVHQTAELSLTFYAPFGAHSMGASTASITLAGRNLWTITDYSVDPGERLRAG